MKKKNRLREWLSIQIAQRPRAVMLAGILLLNVCFFVLAAVIISNLAPATLREHGFWHSIYYTVTMILDAGCIQFVIEDVGTTNVALIIACLLVVVFGSITFTGAVIGYVTNYISEFINSANAGNRALFLSDHNVILNWNSRASEIINDLMYSERKEKIVVLVDSGREAVEQEIDERLSNTVDQDNRELREATKEMGWLEARRYVRKNRVRRNNITVMVREGDTFSTKRLNDVSISTAKTVIILGKDVQNSACKYDYQERLEKYERGNSNTVKTLIQVAELTGRADSADNQKIVVEVDDDWTLNLVNRIIEHKKSHGKSNIVPIAVNRVLGQILSQFSIMPELNSIYGELFSNKGAAFYTRPVEDDVVDEKYVPDYINGNCHAIPLTHMEGKDGSVFYYLADSDAAVDSVDPGDEIVRSYTVEMNKDYWLEKRNVIILGHNSKIGAVMEGFKAFGSEWNFKTPERIAANNGPDIVDITVIDDQKSLERHNYYQKYSFVRDYKALDIYARDEICDAINQFIDTHEGDTSILILSDDMVTNDEMDAKALTYLIYVQDIIADRDKKNPNFDKESIDVVVEILNPKNYDIVRSYSIDNIVISNRYISKMITQIGEKEDIYNFYADILTYDEDEDEDGYSSKELYVKKVSRFFREGHTPLPCTAGQLIRAVYAATPENNKAVVCGYIRKGGKMVLFSGNHDRIPVHLKPTDKLIVFSNH